MFFVQESFATLASIKYLLNEIDILRTEVDTVGPVSTIVRHFRPLL